MLTGGEKDMTPPTLIQEKTIPANYSTHFSSKTIQLNFDEYIQLKDQKKNFFVNPPINEISLEEKGKVILIHIGEPLKENTTYTFNFGSSIQDITENNPLKDFKYVISTGNFIDSNFIDGIVYDAFLKSPMENIRVFLYEKKLDSLTENTIPSYMGFSNNSGNFMLNNLKAGQYYLMAVEDKNGNNLPDPKSEKIAFDTSFVASLPLNDSSDKNILHLFMHDMPLKILEKKYTPPGRFDVVFNKKLALTDIEVAQQNYYIQQKNYSSDTFSFWVDSIPNSPLSFDLAIEKESFLKELKINTYQPSSKDTTLTFKEKNLNNLHPGESLQIKFKHPLKKINSEKLLFLIDSVETKKKYTFNGELWSFNIPEAANSSLELLAEPGAFESIYGFISDSIHLIFSQKKSSSYGNIYLNVNCEKCDSFIIQLIKQDIIIQSFNCSSALKDTINMCNPGDYKLRVIHDLNKDGVWTTGDFNANAQPEPVYYYNEPMEIKPGWSIDIHWVIQ